MNNENLKPFSERTESEKREITKKGGIASGKARRKRADIKKALQSILDETYIDENGSVYRGR